MRKLLVLLAWGAGLVSLVSAGWLSPASGSSDSVQGWTIEQFNPHTGTWNVYLSKQGVALVSNRMGCTVVSKSPQWNVVVYNDKTKVYFMSPLKDLHIQDQLKSGSHADQYAQTAETLKEKPPKKLKDTKLLGHKTSVYLTDNVAQTGMKRFEFWVTPDIQAPTQFKTLFEKIFQVQMANLKGYPLRVSFIDENGKPTPVLDVKNIGEGSVPLSQFNLPANYKRVDSELAVFMDEKGREAMDTIMSDLGDLESEDEVGELIDGKATSKKAYKSQYNTNTESRTDAASSDPALPGEEQNSDWLLFGGIGLAMVLVLGGFAWFFFKSGQPVRR